MSSDKEPMEVSDPPEKMENKSEIQEEEEEEEEEGEEMSESNNEETVNSNNKEENSETTIEDQCLEVSEEECKIDAEELTIEDIYNKDDSSDKDCVLEDPLAQSDSSTQSKTSPPNTGAKDPSTYRMQMSKDEIEKMIGEGTLQKVSEGYYKVKADSLQGLKVASSRPEVVSTGETDKSDSDKPISEKGSISIENDSQMSSDTPTAGPSTPASSDAQQAPSIALVPATQVTESNSFISLLPMKHTLSVSHNSSMPTYVAFTQTSSVSPQPNAAIVTQATAQPTMTTTILKGVKSAEISNLASKSSESITVVPSTSTATRSSTMRSKLTAGESTSHSSPASTPKASSQTGIKRKPQFESTKIKKPYRFAKPLRKRRRTSKLRDFVSDLNSSDEEEDSGLNKSKSYGVELASLFFKKIGEPKKQNKSLMDKLHKAIFNDSNVESEQESDNSELDEIVSDIKAGKSHYQTVNCPGAGIFEAHIGPANNSKLSIIRCQETKQVKNFMYEIYKVRVTSAGREANTNILIPIPDGYKYQVNQKPREEQVGFNHVPHEDAESTNHVNPLFLEKLADTELKLRKYKDEIKVLRGRYLELLQEYANRPQFSTLSDLVGASAKFLTEDQLVFYLMQLKAGAHNMQGIRYSVREKVLALSIYQKSPEVYKWLRKLFNLPSKRILDQWLEDVGAQDPQLLKKLMYHIYTTYNFKVDV